MLRGHIKTLRHLAGGPASRSVAVAACSSSVSQHRCWRRRTRPNAAAMANPTSHLAPPFGNSPLLSVKLVNQFAADVASPFRCRSSCFLRGFRVHHCLPADHAVDGAREGLLGNAGNSFQLLGVDATRAATKEKKKSVATSWTTPLHGMINHGLPSPCRLPS